MSFASLPLEVSEQVIEFLVSENSRDGVLFSAAHLKNLALTCRSILQVCRKYLFETIHMRFSYTFDSSCANNFPSLLRSSPEIAGFTRHLYLRVEKNRESQILLLPELTKFSRLRSYSLSFMSNNYHRHRIHSILQSSISPWYHPLDFEKMSRQTREVLLHPIPTLTTLKLEHIANFPFDELLFNFPNIRDLEISDLKVDDDSTECTISKQTFPPLKLERLCSRGPSRNHASAILKLMEMQQSNGEPVVDFSRLKHLELSCGEESEWNTIRTTLLQTDQLETLTLMPDDTTLDLTGIGRLLLASRMTLKEIHIFNQATIFIDENPFHGLCEELELLGRYPNVLETLSYSLATTPHFACSTGVTWSALDRVINDFPWPKLKRLSIDIYTDIYGDIDDGDCANEEEYEINLSINDFKSRLQNLPQKWLPILLEGSGKDFEFKFAVHPTT
ncbi:hypothetical protein BDN70DRAFT_932588 [Pholiota conissans]|uniref:Uncharacterized protein n=1 Tax=Pholiota conissans TaxID=109636 RepID=A0A9P5Z3X0_9AGAR|nr:hypothetical protein BDN70DRAFT_932588 [Pholiota conissans]